MMLGLLGEIVIEPMKRVGWLSVSATQLLPPSIVFQTPPPGVATKMVLTSDGSAAIALTRPDDGQPPGSGVFTIGAGPNAVHAEEEIGNDVERTTRSSRNST